MKLYKAESQDLVRRFRYQQISLSFCISHLDMALARFMPRMKLGDIDELRAVMLANNEAVMKELAEPAVADVLGAVSDAAPKGSTHRSAGGRHGHGLDI